MKLNQANTPRGRQQGMMLLEALIGILLFSIGILASIAMLSKTIGQVSDAKYRIDASFLANEIISRIWVDRANLANYAYPGGTAPALATWVADVNSALPGTAANAPTVVVDAATGQVTVTVRWQAQAAATPSNHMAIATVANP